MIAVRCQEYFKVKTSFLGIVLCAFLAINLIVLGGVIKVSGAECPRGFSDNSCLELRGDIKRGVRLFCDHILVAPSLGGFFEFFKYDRSLKRTRIVAGPGSNFPVREFQISDGGHIISYGSNSKFETSYRIIYKKKNTNTIRMVFVFRSPYIKSNLYLEIMKLYSDLFLGARIKSYPSAFFDPRKIPETSTHQQRVILRGKSEIELETNFFVLKIKCLGEHIHVGLADFRKSPGDKKRSLVFFLRQLGFGPNEKRIFKFDIKITKKKSIKVTLQKKELILCNSHEKFFLVPPKIKILREGFFALDNKIIIYPEKYNVSATLLARLIDRSTHIKLNIVAKDNCHSNSGIIIKKRSQKKRGYSFNPDAFKIEVTRKLVVIESSSLRGWINAVYTLVSMITKRKNRWFIPCCSIVDWPDLKVRGFCIEVSSPSIRDIRLFRRFINALSRARVNTLIFYHSPEHILDWLKNIDDGSWSESEMREIATYARSLGMKIWVGISSKFRREKFPILEINKFSNFYNPTSDISYRFLFSLYKKVIETYKPAVILIGHDEIKGLLIYSKNLHVPSYQVLARDIKKIRGWLNGQGIKTAIWGDMLLDNKRWNTRVGNANGTNPSYMSGCTHLAINYIPKDVLILDWHYQAKKRYDSIKFFHSKGFKVYGCYWNNPKAAMAMAASCKKYCAEGVFGSNWGFWKTLSPASTTLVGILCGWSEKYQVQGEDEDVLALGEVLRDRFDLSSTTQRPLLSLTFTKNSTISNGNETNGKGIFGIGPVLDLGALNIGEHDFCGVIFHVDSSNNETENNAIIVGRDANDKPNPVAKITVNVGKKNVRYIAFLHTAYIEEPEYGCRSIGNYIIEYEDGSLDKVKILEGWNITDVRSSIGLRFNNWSFVRAPDVLLGSKLVWRGYSLSKIPLNLQMFIWKNKFMHKKIEKIHFIANNMHEFFRIVIPGITFIEGT